MIPRAAREALGEALGDRIEFDAPLSRHTSLRVGGRADALATPRDRADVARLLRVCARHRIAHVVLGAGFNTLVLDGGVAGVVLRMARFRRLEERPGGTLRAEAGVSHSQLTRFCLERGFCGLEFGCGIPGTVGGWLAMNAGIPGHEVGSRVVEVEVMSPTGQHVSHVGRARLHFRYRSLRGLSPGSVLLSALFEISLGERAQVRAEVDRLLAKRARTQPLNVPSCGSVFKNPRGDFAGRLIEAVGLKGHRVGGAEISPVHANFIANVDRATATDVVELIREAQKRVRRETGVELDPEVRIVGKAT